MHRKAAQGFKANFSKGGDVASFEVTPEIAWLAVQTAQLFQLDVAGIDLLFDESGYCVCEANSSPGFKGMERVNEPNIAENILRFILLRLGHAVAE